MSEQSIVNKVAGLTLGLATEEWKITGNTGINVSQPSFYGIISI